MTERPLFPVITGMGLFAATESPWAEALKETALRRGLPAEPDVTGVLRAHFPKGSLRRLPLYARHGLYAAFLALAEAGAFPCPEDTGIVAGTFFGCQKTSFDFMDSILENGPRLSSPLSFSHSVNNMAAGLMSLLLGARGPAFTVNDQELSFAGALQTGLALLQAGRCARVLVGALDESDSRMQEVFPKLPGLGGSVFFCLEMRECGVAPEVHWDTEPQNVPVLMEGEVVSGLPEASLGTSLPQAFECALAVERLQNGAREARIFQSSPRGGSARIDLRVLP